MPPHANAFRIFARLPAPLLTLAPSRSINVNRSARYLYASLCNTDGFLDLGRVEYVHSVATPARSMVTSSGTECGMRFPRTVLPIIRSVLNEVFPSSRRFTEASHII